MPSGRVQMESAKRQGLKKDNRKVIRVRTRKLLE